MKKILSYSLMMLTMLVCGIMGSCSDFEPTGLPDVPVLEKVSDLRAEVSGRTVTLSWVLPNRSDISSVRVSCDNQTPTILPADATSCVLKGQTMDKELIYTVKIEYEGGYVSEGISTMATVPYVASRAAYLLIAESVEALPDDDERAAAQWFSRQENCDFIKASDIPSLDPDIVSVIWIEIDRVGLPLGWENLPSEISNEATIAALKQYSANGGSLLLTNHATQLTVPLGFVPADWNPTVFGSGEGGTGMDVWVINPYLGWDFRDGSDQGFYDRTGHPVYEGITLEDPNNYGYLNVPLIGPGQREDHNCLWDCNIYGRGNQCDVIKNFEVTTNSLVLATWGHVRDHCVAGMVEFYSTAGHGRCIANGFAAYEWNQNSGVNPYQQNVEKLTLNCLNYLK